MVKESVRDFVSWSIKVLPFYFYIVVAFELVMGEITSKLIKTVDRGRAQLLLSVN